MSALTDQATGLTSEEAERLSAHLAEHPLSAELADFFKQWLAWAEGGAPDGEPFLRVAGLCYGARSFGGPTLVRELDGLLEAAYHTGTYPFGGNNYYYHWDRRTQHKDPARLAFVRAVLGAA